MTPAKEPPELRRFGVDRGLADRLGGMEGGWYFWTACLAALEEAIARSRERRMPFCSWPSGELRRLLRDVDDALGLAVTACGLQDLLNGDDEDGRDDERRDDVAELLLGRARERVDG